MLGTTTYIPRTFLVYLFGLCVFFPFGMYVCVFFPVGLFVFVVYFSVGVLHFRVVSFFFFPLTRIFVFQLCILAFVSVGVY